MADYIINLLPVADGGGLQNALSFLTTLEQSELAQKVEVLACAGGAIEEFLESSTMRYRLVPKGRLNRLKFELRVRKFYAEGTVCFTLFGPPLLGGIGYFINVNGCAYSNLFYPDVCFWQDYTGKNRYKRELIDSYRRNVTALADVWVFETQVLSKRAVELCNFPGERVKTVEMAASALVSKEFVDSGLVKKFNSKVADGFKLLFLNGPNRNKRVQNLPFIAEALVSQGETNIQFVTTLPETSDLYRELVRLFQEKGVQEYWVNVGPVEQADVSSLISLCDGMCTFSRLESFSNNFVEAWRMDKLLLATDADWARAACREAALYVDPDSFEEVASEIKRLRSNAELQAVMKAEGARVLATYPSVSEKNEKYIQVLKQAQLLGICPRGIKRLIKWPKVIKKPL